MCILTLFTTIVVVSQSKIKYLQLIVLFNTEWAHTYVAKIRGILAVPLPYSNQQY